MDDFGFTKTLVLSKSEWTIHQFKLFCHVWSRFRLLNHFQTYFTVVLAEVVIDVISCPNSLRRYRNWTNFLPKTGHKGPISLQLTASEPASNMKIIYRNLPETNHYFVRWNRNIHSEKLSKFEVLVSFWEPTKKLYSSPNMYIYIIYNNIASIRNKVQKITWHSHWSLHSGLRTDWSTKNNFRHLLTAVGPWKKKTTGKNWIFDKGNIDLYNYMLIYKYFRKTRASLKPVFFIFSCGGAEDM